MSISVVSNDFGRSLVPSIDPFYVPNDVYVTLARIINKKIFATVFIPGPTGCGKTMAIEQACAQLGRDHVFVSITEEIKESHLFGDFHLVDGNMVWRDGPVLIAMERGAILVLDELPKAHGQTLSDQEDRPNRQSEDWLSDHCHWKLAR